VRSPRCCSVPNTTNLPLKAGDVLAFVEHDGEPIELIATEATIDSHVEFGPESASDFAVAFGLDQRSLLTPPLLP
jgi:hypothetical protein